jgi:adenylate cyclase
LKDEFVFEDRGLIDVKGKGRMPTWFLLGHKTPSLATPGR